MGHAETDDFCKAALLGIKICSNNWRKIIAFFMTGGAQRKILLTSFYNRFEECLEMLIAGLDYEKTA